MLVWLVESDENLTWKFLRDIISALLHSTPQLHTHLASSCHLFQTNEQYLLISIPCQALKLLFKELL